MPKSRHPFRCRGNSGARKTHPPLRSEALRGPTGPYVWAARRSPSELLHDFKRQTTVGATLESMYNPTPPMGTHFTCERIVLRTRAMAFFRPASRGSEILATTAVILRAVAAPAEDVIEQRVVV